MTAGAAHTKAWWSIAAWSGERGVRYRVRGRYFRSRASCVYVVHVIVKPVGLKKRRVRQRALMTRPPARAAAPRARARPPARARRPAPRRTPPRAPARAARHARAWRAPSSRVPPQAALAHSCHIAHRSSRTHPPTRPPVWRVARHQGELRGETGGNRTPTRGSSAACARRPPPAAGRRPALSSLARVECCELTLWGAGLTLLCVSTCRGGRRNLYNVHHLKKKSTHGRVSRLAGDQLRRKPAESACWRGDAPPAPLRNALLSSRKSTWLGLGLGLG